MGKPRCRRSVLIVGDVHFPWHSRKTLWAIYRHAAKLKPDVIIQIGDLLDLFSFSKFPRTHNIYTPAQELKYGRGEAENFWSSLQKACPKARCIQLFGNHENRAVKKTITDAPELESFVKDGMHSLMRFDGVETMDDSREVLKIDDVYYNHGYLLQPGAHARAFLENVVVGHTHFGCVVPVKLETKLIWELNVGYAANRHAVPMSYGQQRRFSRWTLGFGWVDHLGPRFIPLDTEEPR